MGYYSAVKLPWVQRVLWLLVTFCILYVLISPLPEVDATLSGKLIPDFFVLVTYALLGLLVLIPSSLRSFRLHWFAENEVLCKSCVRLC